MLPSCLDALTEFNEIHLVDSGSTDATLAIARTYKVNIHNHSFESFGKQRNWALDHCQVSSDWILFLDADEIATPRFKETVFTACRDATDNTAGFFLCNRIYLNGQWLRHSANFPTWQFRLHRVGRARFTDFGHGQKEGKVEGELNYIQEPYNHYPFYKGWTEWFDKHNRYATQEALARQTGQLNIKNIFSTQGSCRNVALKLLLTHIPGWPLLRFMATYIIKGGFLDGHAGFIYCTNMAWYEYLVKLKMLENKNTVNATKNHS